MNFRDGRARQGGVEGRVSQRADGLSQALKTGGSSAGQVGLCDEQGAGLTYPGEMKRRDLILAATPMEKLCPEAHPTPTCTASQENP